MTSAAKLIRELVGLFVDDGALALAILGTIFLAWIVAAFVPGTSIAAGAVLLLGCLAVLFLNVMKAARR